jgi:G3E family GTPase
MAARTPMTLITGPLGAGKTTLLGNLLGRAPGKIAVIVNEFGEIAVDGRIIEGKNVRMIELTGGCVCCSLTGELDSAIGEILATTTPDAIVVETTGVAEADALIFNIQESQHPVRLDAVIAVADADAMVRFPVLGRTARAQFEAADLILLNKTDLVPGDVTARVKAELARVNPRATVLRCTRCDVAPEALLGQLRERDSGAPDHLHDPEFESFVYKTAAVLEAGRFESFIGRLGESVYRAKGFVVLSTGSYLFNYVAGRWESEPFAGAETALVFIGERGRLEPKEIAAGLGSCEI